MDVEAPHPFPPRYMRSSIGGEKGKKENSTWAALGSEGDGIWDSTFQVAWTGSIPPTAAVPVPNMAARTAENRDGFPAFSWALVAESTVTALYGDAIKNHAFNRTCIRARTVEFDRYCTYLEPFVTEATSQYRFMH